MGKKVLVVDGGARGHALLWKLVQSKRIAQLFVAPGNAGCAKHAECIPNKVANEDGVLSLAKEAERRQIDLTIVGSDNPLALGIVDVFRGRGLRIYGPTRAADQIEADKIYAKKLMTVANIPTAPYRDFYLYDEAREYAETVEIPAVVKAAGLALGKGVDVCQTRGQVLTSLKAKMKDHVHGEHNTAVLIEKCLQGREVSAHAFCDGRRAHMMPFVKDHKTLLDGDRGDNTGGMGAYGPVPWLSRRQRSQIYHRVVKPAVRELANQHHPYMGVLYPGLMMTAQGPMVLEYNARFGDPEAQVLMRLLKTDLLAIIEACLTQRRWVPIRWRSGYVVCVVLASQGYPQAREFPKRLITGIEDAERMSDVVVFHAGTVNSDGKYYTSGGRVLSVTAWGRTLMAAHVRAYDAVDRINFEGKVYRTDIAGPAAFG